MSEMNPGSVDELITEAKGFHSRGEVAEAAALYERALATAQEHAEATHLLGLTMHQLGNSEAGLALMRRGIELNPTDAGYHSNCGSALKRLGRYEEALESFEASIRLNSNFLPALYNAGEVYCALDLLEEGEATYRKAVAIRPDMPDIWSNLGTCLVKREKWDEALEVMTKTLELDPHYAAAHFGKGHVQEQLGQLVEARQSFNDAMQAGYSQWDCLLRLATVAQAEGLPEAAVEYLEAIIDMGKGDEAVYNNLAIAYQELGQEEKAIAAVDKALAIEPLSALALCTKSSLLIDAGRFDEAAQAAGKAAFCDRSSDIAYNNLGTAYRGLGRLEEAKKAYESAIGINAEREETHNNLALVLQRLGDFDAMERSYKAALELNPRYATSLVNLAAALIELGRLSEAVDLLRQAIDIDESMSSAWENLGRALYELGDFEGSKEAYLTALKLDPGNAQARVAMAATQIANRDIDDSTLFRYHREAGEAVEANVEREALDLEAHVSRAKLRGRLRLGFVSADFKAHSVAYFLLSLFQKLDRGRFEVYAYSRVTRPDSTTRQFETAADAWRLVAEQPDEMIVQQIREDGIDILFDLAGFTAGHALGVFAAKPAPLLISWLGYAHSTGMRRMDYRIVDEKTDPEGGTLNSETLLYLPGSFISYSSPESMPDVAPPPSQRSGRVTFGSFNNIVKLNESSIDLFASALKAVEGSLLVLKSHQTRDSAVKDRVWRLFADRGIDKSRVELLPRLPSLDDHFNSYGKIDIALDTYPYNGTTTTCEALAMGVPVITLAGTRHAARVGCSLLGSVGLEDLVASDQTTFASIAKELALNIGRRDELRNSLRDRLKASLLGDADRFTSNMEKAIQEVWDRLAATTRAIS